MSISRDPRVLLHESPMSRFQIMAVLICILLNALDGFDVLAISFASPGISSDWGINRAELGVVLAMELVGMAIGSVFLGGIADRYGRRPTILGCLVVMSAGMYAAALVSSIPELLVIRFLTGVGIGGMLASTNAMTAEFSNKKHRNLAVILMATGYPLGAIAGGSVATVLLQHFDWRVIFEFGAACTAVFLIVVWFWLPESIEYLSSKQPNNALQRINTTLQKMGHAALSQLPESTRTEKQPVSYQTLFSNKYRALTILLIIGYFAHIMTFYYMIKWIPKIVVDMGYGASSAGAVLVWANVGGAIGALTLGLLATKYKLRGMLIGVLVLAFIMVSLFGLGQETLSGLSIVAASAGFFTNGGVVGFYALIASAFPSDIRASGTGVVIGFGRGGAALGPVLAGILFAAGFGLLAVSIVMAAGAAIAVVAVLMLKPVLKNHDIPANI